MCGNSEIFKTFDLTESARYDIYDGHLMISSSVLNCKVHACDVVDKMVQENVQNINDFEWISQLRYCRDYDFRFLLVMQKSSPWKASNAHPL